MTTRYRNTLVIYTPPADWLGMNALAALFGESRDEAELQTFRSSTRTRDSQPYGYLTTSVTDYVKGALQLHQAGQLTLATPEWDTDGAVNVAAATATLDGALVLLAFDPENPPAYNGQTIIALNVPAGAIEAAYGFARIEE